MFAILEVTNDGVCHLFEAVSARLGLSQERNGENSTMMLCSHGSRDEEESRAHVVSFRC